MIVFDITIVIVFQNIFYLKTYENNIYFLKNFIFNINMLK